MNLSFRSPLSSLISALLSAAAAVAGLSLAACNGAVGSGNAPRNLVIAAPSTTVVLPTLHMNQCLTSGLRALLYFTDGSVGDFTARVKWSSSNPGAVQVSNGDIAGPGGVGFYANGALIPGGPGSAVVTADYFGITSQVAIGVGTPASIQVKTIQNGIYTPLNRFNINHNTSAGNGITVAAGSSVQLAVTAMLDGVETDVTKFATLAFQFPNNQVATISSTGLLTTTNIGSTQTTGPLVPVASFPSCTLTNISDPTNIINLVVSRVQSVVILPEFPPDPTTNVLPQLIVGNNEKFTVVATMANGDTQDVSAQSTYTLLGNNSGAAFITGANGSNNLLSATAAGAVTIQAEYTGGTTQFTAPSLNVTTGTGQLLTITTCWSDPYTYAYTSIPFQTCQANQSPALVQAGVLTPVQYHNIGSYGDDANGVPITQEITRETVWSTFTPAIATIIAGGVTAGLASGVAQGTTQVEANVTSTTVKVNQVYSQLNVAPSQQ